MTLQHRVGIVGVALMLSAGTSITAATGGSQAAGGENAAATAAAKASPELVGALSKELNSTPEQAAGAAGALFGVAKSRLKADEFAQVSKAVPGMTALLGAAPALGGAGGKSNPLSQMAGLAGAASAFSKLGLKPDLVSKAVPVLTSFVTKSGGADVGKLLAGALK
jgi:Protein of unknown function VcgC/VcgE (DUF2780)